MSAPLALQPQHTRIHTDIHTPKQTHTNAHTTPLATTSEDNVTATCSKLKRIPLECDWIGAHNSFGYRCDELYAEPQVLIACNSLLVS